MAAVKRPRTKKGIETSTSHTVSAMTSVKSRSLDLQEAIRERAYELYKERGDGNGDAVQDWVRAEREILERFRRTA